MYDLIIKDDLDIDNPYLNRIILHNISLETAFKFIELIEKKNSYYYEIIKHEGE